MTAQNKAWNILFFGSLFFLIVLPLRDYHSISEGPGYFWKLTQVLPSGIAYTALVTFSGSAVAIAVGLLVGLGKLSKNKIFVTGASLYTEALRGIPLLVLLFYVYYALGEYIQVPALGAAILSFGFCYGAYMADVFRAGIEAIPPEQLEAARSLGLNYKQAMRKIVLPQAMRTIIPSIGTQTLGMLKDTSLVSVLAIADILRIGNEFAAKNFNYFETYTFVALTYLFLTLLMARAVSYLENRFTLKSPS